MRAVSTVSAVVMGLGIVGAVAAPAAAADLTCTGAPGGDAVVIDGITACGSRADAGSTSYARSIDAVAFAAAAAGGNAAGLAQGGAVAAAETTSGTVAAIAYGPLAVSIVSADPGAVVFAASTPGAQTFVGTRQEGVRCDAGPGVAANFTTGQACLSDGASIWTVQ